MLTGYKAMITGATSGIGLATAKEFIAQGAQVIGLGRNFSRTKDLGDAFIPFHCEVTDEEQIIAACRFAEETFGKLDTLICNAGSGIRGGVEDVTAEDYDRASHLYLRAPVLFTKYCVGLLRRSGNPSIAHTASVASFMIGDNVPYTLFKSALVNYTRQSAAGLLNANPRSMFNLPAEPRTVEGNPYIRVNAVCPGLIRTNLMPDPVWDALNTPEMLAQIPSGRIGEAWEVAKLFAFLASPKATFITGAAITIDGGWWTTHPRA